MKILHLSHSDLFGGAARSAYNIHKSLCSVGIDSKMLVIKKKSKDKNVIQLENFNSKYYQKIKNYIFILISKLFFEGKSSFNFFPNKKLINKIKLINADYVFIHWVHAEMISVNDLKKIKKKIFIMHDMWWIGRHEHYFNTSIEKKKILDKSFFNQISFSQIMYEKKRKLKLQNIITPSQWMLECVKKMLPYKNQSKRINYPIDLKVFRNNKKYLNKKKIKLLYIGFGKIDTYRKGLDLLYIVINNIKYVDIDLIVVGEIDKKVFSNLEIKIKFIKNIDSNKKLNEIYNKSDILLFTSRQDNLPNVVMEALSTGLPVIGFNIGGLKDLIKDNFNGFLCKPFDTKEYSSKLKILINNKKIRDKFSKESLKFAKNNFSYKNIGKKYLSYLNGL